MKSKLIKIVLSVTLVVCLLPTIKRIINAETQTITPPSVTTWTYDGQDHQGQATVSGGGALEYATKVKESDDWSSWSSTIPSIKNVGKLYVKAKVDSNEIEYTLTVNKRNVTVKTASSTKSYDATPLTNNTPVEISGDGFVDGEVTCTANGSITKVGKQNNTIKYEWGAGKSENNYNINEKLGELTVTKITTPIIITTATDDKMYDGSPLTNTTWTYTPDVLCSGDALDVVVNGSITNFGSTKNTIQSYMVKNGDEDRTDCYTFGEPVLGTLTITSIIDNSKSNVTVDKKDGTKLTKSYTAGSVNQDCVIDLGLTITTTSANVDWKVKLATGPVAGTYIPVDLGGGDMSVKLENQNKSTTLSALSDYKIEEGSLKITISKDYIKTLPVGNNVINIVIKGGTDGTALTYNYSLNIPIEYGDTTSHYTFVNTSAR